MKMANVFLIYEIEKRKLQSLNLSSKEYERRIKELIKKYKI